MRIPPDTPFSVFAMAAIIEQNINGERCVLLQNRIRSDDKSQDGLIEIPSGKIQRGHDIFASIKRRVFEETGLVITGIAGCMLDNDGVNNIITAKPFYMTQSLIEDYPVITCFFICEAVGTPQKHTSAANNIRWISIDNLRIMLKDNPDSFFSPDYPALLEYIMNI